MHVITKKPDYASSTYNMRPDLTGAPSQLTPNIQMQIYF